MPYTYQADVYCDECGERIRREIASEGNAPQDPEDETSYDSGDYPKWYDAESEESDGPENCANGQNCEHKQGYGLFLENQLTSEGYKYLKSMLDEHGPDLPAHAEEWADFYGFSYHGNEYHSAHDWLNQVLEARARDREVNALYSFAVDLASKLDSDQIQDLFQTEMEDDGFFKPSGWYSSEME